MLFLLFLVFDFVVVVVVIALLLLFIKKNVLLFAKNTYSVLHTYLHTNKWCFAPLACTGLNFYWLYRDRKHQIKKYMGKKHRIKILPVVCKKNVLDINKYLIWCFAPLACTGKIFIGFIASTHGQKT